MVITKEFTFDSSHKLDWELGKCKNLQGHTYKLHVSIKEEVNENRIVFNFSDFKNIVNENIIKLLDYKHFNDIISNPTAENIVKYIWRFLKEKLLLYEIKLWETPISFVNFRGD